MQIGIDISTLVNHGQDIGAGRYIYNLVDNLLKIDKKNSYVLFGRYLSNNYLDIAYNLADKSEKVRLKLFKTTEKSLRYWNKLRFPPFELLGVKADVMHFPDFLIAPALNNNIVLTINDLSFIRFPEFNFEWFIKKYSKEVKQNARKAKNIIAISKSTKSDIIEFFEIEADKIKVVYPAADKIFRNLDKEEIDKSILKKHNIEKKYILSVGTIEPRKNYITLIEAYNLLRKDIDIQLVIVGRTGWKSEQTFQKREESLYKNDILFLGKVPDKELAQIYNQAEVFSYPSVFEGFGLPPLEAMSCGVPVIASNTSSLPEVIGHAGILIPPKSPTILASFIRNILKDKRLRKTLSSNSLNQAKKFSWEINAEKTLDVYSSLI